MGLRGVSGLVLTHWWAELGPWVSGCRALGVLRLVPPLWWVVLDLRATG